jgi:hypothetical protein
MTGALAWRGVEGAHVIRPLFFWVPRRLRACAGERRTFLTFVFASEWGFGGVKSRSLAALRDDNRVNAALRQSRLRGAV